MEQYLDVRPSYLGSEDTDFVAMNAIDVQKVHSTISTFSDLRLGVVYPLTYLTTNNLHNNVH